MPIDYKFWLQVVILLGSLAASYAATIDKLNQHIEDTQETLRVNREICSAVKTASHLPVDSCYITER